MPHQPIHIQGLELSFGLKTCFTGFTHTLYGGARVGIIGRNGSGKSSLLKMFDGSISPTQGDLKMPPGMTCGYVPQAPEDLTNNSGGARFHTALTQALAQQPQILLLDEPTNHLDAANRANLMRMLAHYRGTLLIASHDRTLLQDCTTELWSIAQTRVTVFCGTYRDFVSEKNIHNQSLTQERSRLTREKKELHAERMQAQERVARGKAKGRKDAQNNKWAPVVGNDKASKAQVTAGRRNAALAHQQQQIAQARAGLEIVEEITPHFALHPSSVSGRSLINIRAGTVAHPGAAPLLQDISMGIGSQDRVAICGNNGTGKSTLFQAILSDPRVTRTGDWHLPPSHQIGYLDQHYRSLDPQQTPLEMIALCMPGAAQSEHRRHLNDFLFRKNEEVNTPIEALSGGEKARLCLAQIAARPPALLLMDEITNNLDMETRDHVITLLQAYRGAFCVISHDDKFLDQIALTHKYTIAHGTLMLL